jgi:predicted CoA-substrate-specific enzyme activase
MGPQRFIGVDAGAESLKLVELVQHDDGLHVAARETIEHGKRPAEALAQALERWGWPGVTGVAATGRFAESFALARIPTRHAQERACRLLFGREPATVLSIGSRGFSVLELRADAPPSFRENSRCSQGTGNFLRQLVERFSLTVEEASAMVDEVTDPASLSGRCPVILKTDMTHLANRGEDRARILAGLFDAVTENLLALVRPGLSPERVVLVGGVARSPRVRRVIGQWLAQNGMRLLDVEAADALTFDALGAALGAADDPEAIPPPLDRLIRPVARRRLERLPSLSDSLPRVTRMPARPLAGPDGRDRRLAIGIDVGSTGSKLVALDVLTREVVSEGYRRTLGDPVGAAQELLRAFLATPAASWPIVAFGATGSGRDVAGSLLTSCYGRDAVFIVNEIVAHAAGALHYDRRVDTIFEIGGQDAKYIRLSQGRIVDCAMNEACSAGTGSFIEEQGRKFAGIDVAGLGEMALAAPCGVSLGQHCSVFMAEVIDEAAGAGVGRAAIAAGLYDSIVQNYLNRVKGNRTVGDVIFCQGMPFSSAALAAAVARQTGSRVIVPPGPGMVGALGIALLAAEKLEIAALPALDPAAFLEARVEQKDSFVCRSKQGCGGAGIQCRIERLRTSAGGRSTVSTWGGGCALHDRATRRRKLPDLAPDPFRAREALRDRSVPAPDATRPRVAMSDEFMLKGLFPFFAGFFAEAGFALDLLPPAGRATLKAGIRAARVPFCAPMQMFHGLARQMAEGSADYIFLPMVRSLPREDAQRCSATCPIVQACPDVTRWMLGGGARAGGHARLLSPVIDFARGNFRSPAFLDSLRDLARRLGLDTPTARRAWEAGVAAQDAFEAASREIGREALAFCAGHGVTPVVVLGRAYTIYNDVLNSNVPAILREQGALAIPIDCYPVGPETPFFDDMYWGYAQSILRAAHQVRRTEGVYAVYCSNYSCGPDSFTLHCAAHVMEGKPFTVIETDGHSGDAGTRTRIEAFLHCVEEDRQARAAGPAPAPPADTAILSLPRMSLGELRAHALPGERLLIPYLGPLSAAASAVFRGLGMAVEALPPPDASALAAGRRFTSGKECVPMVLTLGSLIRRIEQADEGERFAYLMPATDGPCRFGVYNLLNRIVLDRRGWRDRVRIWAPKDVDYFDGIPAGVEMLLFATIVTSDLLLRALHHARPAEREPGAANAAYARLAAETEGAAETAAQGDLGLWPALGQVLTGRLFGLTSILSRAARTFSALAEPRDLPRVELAGEIYVRSVPFSNDSLVEQLEAHGLRVVVSPVSEWNKYCSHMTARMRGRSPISTRLSAAVQERIERAAWNAIAPRMGWPPPISAAESLAAASPYLSDRLEGEAVLTLGSPLHAWRRGQIDAVVSVGPLECMPSKIAEAQFQHIAEREGLPSLSVSFNGEPLAGSTIADFAFDVRRRARPHSPPLAGRSGTRGRIAEAAAASW